MRHPPRARQQGLGGGGTTHAPSKTSSRCARRCVRRFASAGSSAAPWRTSEAAAAWGRHPSYGSAVRLKQRHLRSGARHAGLPGVGISQVGSPVDSVDSGRTPFRAGVHGRLSAGWAREVCGCSCRPRRVLSCWPPRTRNWTVDTASGRPVETFRHGGRSLGTTTWPMLAASDVRGTPADHVVCRHPRGTRRHMPPPSRHHMSHAATLRRHRRQSHRQERAEPAFQSSTERFQSP